MRAERGTNENQQVMDGYEKMVGVAPNKPRRE